MSDPHSSLQRNTNESAEEAGGLLRTLVMVVVFVAGIALFARVVKPADHPMVGKPAPEFKLPSLLDAKAAPVALADLKGKPVLLDFWASWCGPCQAQSPIVDAVAKRWKDRGLVVVGVDTNDLAFAGKSWASSHRVTYSLLSDEDGTVSRSYNVASLPTLVLLSKDGTVKEVRVGMTDEGELDRLIQKEL